MDNKYDKQIGILDWLIFFSIIILIIMVYVPLDVWSEESHYKKIRRDRMQYIASAEQFFYELTGRYTTDIDELFPLVEAAIYESGDSDLRDEASLVQIPVHIMRAKLRDLSNPDEIFGFSPTDPEVVDWFSNATELYLPDANHFLPMEHPSFVADQIMKFHGRVYV